MRHRDAMYYIMTGNPFDGKKAAEMGLVNESVPKAKLRERTRALAMRAEGEEPDRAARLQAGRAHGAGHELGAVGRVPDDQEPGRPLPRSRSWPQQGLKQFLDDKSFKPGLGTMKRDEK